MERSSTEGSGKVLAPNTALFKMNELMKHSEDIGLYKPPHMTDKGNPIINPSTYPRPAKLQIPNNKCVHVDDPTMWKEVIKTMHLKDENELTTSRYWTCKICGIVAYINPIK